MLSTSLRIRHEREADIRIRMLEAATTFAGTAYESVDALRGVKANRVMAATVREQAVKMGQPVPRPTKGIDTEQVRDIFEALIRLNASVRVLFGPDSRTASAADDVWRRLFDDIEAEEAAIEAELSDTTGHPITVLDSPQLREHIDSFSRSARRDLRGSIR